MVFDRRFRQGKWSRRSRLVAREFKQASQRDDVFSPATNTSLVRVLPALALQKEMKLYSIDIKDAFLQVPQKRKTACLFPQEYLSVMAGEDEAYKAELQGQAMILLRVLPGQRDAAVLWSDFFNDELERENQIERNVACPTLYRRPSGSFLVIHVDDIQAGEVEDDLKSVIKNLSGKFEMKIEGPFLTPEEYAKGFSENSIRFLKRKFVYSNYVLHINPGPKYLQKLEEALKIKSKGSKPTPCTHEAQLPDDSKELDSEKSSLCRKCVGILLYMPQERPDIQFSIRDCQARCLLLLTRLTSNLCTQSCISGRPRTTTWFIGRPQEECPIYMKRLGQEVMITATLLTVRNIALNASQTLIGQDAKELGRVRHQETCF